MDASKVTHSPPCMSPKMLMPMEEVSIDPDAMAAVGGLDLSVCEWSAAQMCKCSQ